MKWIVKDLSDLSSVASAIADKIDEKVVLFKGEMGAGKTTLIKALAKTLGVEDEVSSPTFSIVNQYLGRGEVSVFHFDFYRIEDEEEAYDFGYEEYFYSGNLCLVEWPEKITNLLPSNFGLVQVEQINDTRKISFQPSTTNFPV